MVLTVPALEPDGLYLAKYFLLTVEIYSERRLIGSEIGGGLFSHHFLQISKEPLPRLRLYRLGFIHKYG